MESVPDRGGPERAINLRGRDGVIVGYEPFAEEDGNSFTCDNCNEIHTEGYADDYHAICTTCAHQKYEGYRG